MDVAAIVHRFDPDAPIARAETPPASWYVDPRVHALERRAVFQRRWLRVALRDRVTVPGAQVGGCIAGLPWLLVRDTDAADPRHALSGG